MTLTRYIFFDEESKAAFIRRCNKNFWVCVLINTDGSPVDKNEASGSSSKEAMKPSRHTLHYIKVSTGKKMENAETSTEKTEKADKITKFPSTSKLHNAFSKFNQKSSSNYLEANKEEPESPKGHKKGGYELFKKLIGLQKTTKASSTSNTSIEELFLKDYSFNENTKDAQSFIDKESQLTKYKIPISFIEASSPHLDYTLTETMREVIDLSNKLQYSEMHIKDLILKYINDKNLEKDLISSICGHGKLLLESERRALNLASETWLQQADIYKDQQKSLQNTLNSIVHQNRQLHDENETLSKQNEKLSMKILMDNNDNATSTGKRSSNTITMNRFSEDLSKSNDKLRSKLNFALVRIDELEKHLKRFQKKSSLLHDQLTNSNLQLQNSRALFERTKADHELEVAKLLQELQTNSKVMTEAVDAGDFLLNDLQLLRTQVKSLNKIVVWDKFKNRGKNVSELIHLSRSCVNELLHEVTTTQTDKSALQEKYDKLQVDNEKQSQMLDDLHNSKETLEKKLAEITEESILFNQMKDKYTQLEQKLESFEQLLTAKNLEIQIKNETVKQYEEELMTVKTIINKDKVCMEKLEVTLDSILKEKEVLQTQVNGMVQVLSATGAGEVTKELVTTQEKLAQLQQDYYTLLSEKNVLQKEVDANKEEKKTLIAYQQTCYDQLQVQLKEMEQLEKTNDALKEQLDAEKQTVQMLQTERVRHLEERTILTAIYERLKHEASKVDQLEDVLLAMNKKASRLAIIAQYNKQLGEKLKHEVAERDVAITELQNNVKELNNFQVETSREKVALCEELNQVFSDKEYLNVKLAKELERNVLLDETKKEIETNATLKLKEIQSMYLRERSTLKSLLKEMKSIMLHRDVLNEQNTKSEEQIKVLETERADLEQRIECLTRIIAERDEQINNLEEILNEKRKEMEMLKENMEEKIAFHKNNGNALKDIYEPVSKENVTLRKSVDYLQDNVSKLREDLETLKESEKVYKTKIEEDAQTYSQLMEKLKTKTAELDSLAIQNDELKEELANANDKYNNLLYEYEKISDDATHFESILEEKFSTCKKSPDSSSRDEIETPSNSDATKREEEILAQQERIRELEEQIMELNDLLQTITKQRDSLKLNRGQMEKDLKKISVEYNQSLQTIANLQEQLNQNQIEHEMAVNELQNDNSQYKQTLQTITNEFEGRIKNLNDELHQITDDLNDVQSKYERQTEDKKCVDKAHKDMAFKMLRAVQLLIAEKVAREKSEKSIKSLEEQMSVALTRKDKECETKLNTIESELNQLMANYEKIRDEKIRADVMLQQFENTVTNTSMSEEKKLAEYENRLTAMKAQLDQSHAEILSLHEQLCNLESTCSSLEFEKCEAILKLHEYHGKVQTEKIRNEELQESLQNTLSVILKMREDGSITPAIYTTLLETVRGSTKTS